MSDERYVMGRRGVLLGGAALASVWSLGCGRGAVAGTPVRCVLTPEQVEGPYYLDDAMLRSDLREDRPGVPLAITVRLSDVRTCGPLEGAAVDLWHCDGSGVYSGFTAESARPMPPGGPPPFRGRPPGPPPGERGFGPPPHRGRSDPGTFLRGVQLSDAAGIVRFVTIYPGWYNGRAVHIHLRVRTEGALRGASYAGGHVAHTGQLYLPETLSDEVFRLPPYASHAGERLRQGDDGIFADGGAAGLLTVTPRGGDRIVTGFDAVASVMLDPKGTPEVRGGPR